MYSFHPYFSRALNIHRLVVDEKTLLWPEAQISCRKPVYPCLRLQHADLVGKHLATEAGKIFPAPVREIMDPRQVRDYADLVRLVQFFHDAEDLLVDPRLPAVFPEPY